MIKNQLILLFFVFTFLTACSSPDDEARELISEARKMYKACDSINPYTSKNELLENCITILTKASGYMELLYESYGATPASNEILTYQLKGKIKSRIFQYKLGLKRKNEPEKVWDSGPSQW